MLMALTGHCAEIPAGTKLPLPSAVRTPWAPTARHPQKPVAAPASNVAAEANGAGHALLPGWKDRFNIAPLSGKTSVSDVLAMWHHGHNGQPSIVQMEATFKAKWRAGRLEMPARRVKAVIVELHKRAGSCDIDTYTAALDAVAAAMDAERLSMTKSVSERVCRYVLPQRCTERRRPEEALAGSNCNSAETFIYIYIYIYIFIHITFASEPVAKSFVLAIQSRTLSTTNKRIPISGYRQVRAAH